MAHRYVWSGAAGAWVGGEEDMMAEGARDITAWRPATQGGWIGGKQLPPPVHLENEDDIQEMEREALEEGDAEEEEDPEEVIRVAKKGKGKRKSVGPVVKTEPVDRIEKGEKKRKSTVMEATEVVRKGKKGKQSLS